MRFSDNDTPRSIEIAGHALRVEQVAAALQRSLLIKRRLTISRADAPLLSDNLPKEQAQ